MKEMYLISVLGTLNDVVWVIFGCAIAFIVFTSLPFFMDDFDEDWHKIIVKIYKICGFVIIPTTLLLGILIPTKGDLYMIYGVGSVIDYVQESDDAKQLPEKTIKMLNALADKYTEKKEDK